jgi:uncharacterized protein (DUF58 family)
LTVVRWWPLLGLVFLAGVVLGIYPLAIFAVMLLAIGGLARWWHSHALDHIAYLRVFHYRRGFPGEKILMQAEVENWKFLPVSWLRVQDFLPIAVGPQDESLLRPTPQPEVGQLISLFSLRWYERDRRRYTLLLRKRGLYRLGPARLSSGDPFGLFEDVEQVEGSQDVLTVFPQPLSYSAMHLPADDPFGDRRALRRLYEDPNLSMGVRDYRPDDDFRRVHWPATAHTGSLQVKVYQPISAQVLVVCLNASTLPHFWEGHRPELLEYLVSYAAALAQRGLEEGYRVGLISNGCLGSADQPFRVPPGRSPEQLSHLLTALAGVTPIVAGPFERFLSSESPRLPYGATLVVVTALTSPALAETLLRLKKHGRRVTLIAISESPPAEIQGVHIVHIPYVA